MTIRAAILDFDGTLVTKDILDLLCDLVGQKEESEKINRLFQEGKLKGLEGLIRRINLLKGLSVAQIKDVVATNDYLRVGAEELFSFFRQNNIVSVIASGSILPLLEVYKNKLGVDYLIGSKPIMADGYLVSISETEYSGPDFKVRDCNMILEKLDIAHTNVIAIGDSPADKGIFKLAEKRIAINPRGDIADFADYTIQDDLSLAIPILEDLMSS